MSMSSSAAPGRWLIRPPGRGAMVGFWGAANPRIPPNSQWHKIPVNMHFVRVIMNFAPRYSPNSTARTFQRRLFAREYTQTVVEIAITSPNSPSGKLAYRALTGAKLSRDQAITGNGRYHRMVLFSKKIFVARPARLERATLGFEDRYSIRLSYGRVGALHSTGAGGREGAAFRRLAAARHRCRPLSAGRRDLGSAKPARQAAGRRTGRPPPPPGRSPARRRSPAAGRAPPTAAP